MTHEKLQRVGPAWQRGATTTAMSLILLVLITMVAGYTGRTVLFEQKMSANDFRGRQAFEAAESGLATAMTYLAAPGDADKDDDGVIDPVFDTDADGIGDSTTMTYADNSSVTVTVGGVFPAYNVQATGFSDDRTAMRLVRAIGASIDALPNVPGNPLTSRGTVIVNGAATVHNPEGHSTIWSGEDVDLGSNNATATEIADPNDANYPVCMESAMTCGTTRSSSKVAIGVDVVPNDSTLGNLTDSEMFQNFFGISMANYQESRVTLEVSGADANNLATAGSPGIHLGVGEVIWVEGNTSLSNVTTVGCEAPVVGAGICANADLDPSIVIINGDLVADGTPTFYGLVYVVGNLALTGNAAVHGALIVGGNAANSAGGSLDVWYNSDVLANARNNGPLSASAGSWRDW